MNAASDLFGEPYELPKAIGKAEKKQQLRKEFLSNGFDLDVFRQNPGLPCFLSFSGGRTSALMLYYTLVAYDWKLPENFYVIFLNTGMEHPKTLDFVKECADRWGVDIHWLEWRNKDVHGISYIEVNYETASRHGEPYASLIDKQGYCPNRVARTCTGRLKIRVLRDFIRSQPWYVPHVDVFNVIGLRADEEMRVMNATDTDGYNSSEGLIGKCPLAEAGITKMHVDAFWTDKKCSEGFDLGIQSEAGNCTLCFLKSRRKLISLVRQNPSLADWWIEQEDKCSATAKTGAQFNRDWAYRELLEHVQTQPELMDINMPDFETIPCSCTD